jgi:hypothetical protein
VRRAAGIKARIGARAPEGISNDEQLNFEFQTEDTMLLSFEIRNLIVRHSKFLLALAVSPASANGRELPA